MKLDISVKMVDSWEDIGLNKENIIVLYLKIIKIHCIIILMRRVV